MIRLAMHPRIRLVVVLATLFAWITASAGVLPTSDWFLRVSAQLAGERFPCEGGRCGCLSARECWTSCSCQPIEFKLAWAEREGVEVPSYVDVAARLAEGGQAAACPLCESVKPKPRSLPIPELSPLGCKGIELLAAGGALLGIRDDAIGAPETEPASACVWTPDELRPVSRALGAPTPPPRA